MKQIIFFVLFIVSSLVGVSNAGPIMAGSAVSFCYTACNVGYVTCLAGYGIVAGTTGPIGWYAWFTSAPIACSLTQAACMSACTAGGVLSMAAPTP